MAFQDSSSSQSVATLSSVILSGAQHWNDWIAVIQHTAKDRQVWQYIDPDTDAQPAEPVRPEEPVEPVEVDATAIALWNVKRQAFEIKERRFNRFNTVMTEMSQLILKTIKRDYIVFFTDPEAKTLW